MTLHEPRRVMGTPIIGDPIVLTVYGTPVQQSGTRIVPAGHKGSAGRRGISTGGKGLAEWRQMVAAEASKAAAIHGKLDGPLRVDFTWRFRMPPSRKPAIVRRHGQGWHATTPDKSKLIRAAEDSLKTGGLIADDKLIAAGSWEAYELTDGWTGALIMVARLVPMHELEDPL